MKKLAIILIVVVVLAAVTLSLLNIFPEIENWLHNVTGWH